MKEKIVQGLISGVVALAVALLVVAMVGGNNQPQQLGATGTRFPNGLSTTSTSPSAGELRTTTLTVGGAATLSSTLDVTGDVTLTADTFDIGAVNYASVQQDYSSSSAATSTPCSLQNPFSATSTLISYNTSITTGTTTGMIITVATSTTAFATTTLLVQDNSATSSRSGLIRTANHEIGPSHYINVGLRTVNGSDTQRTENNGSVVTGTCSALFMTP